MSRVAGLTVDVFLISLAAVAIRLLPGVVWQEVLGGEPPRWLTAVAGVAATTMPWAYFTFTWWLAGQTVGGLLLGIEVRDSAGGDLGLIHAAVRAAIGLLLAPVWVVGLVTVLWDEKRRALHDRLLRTVVRYSTRARAQN